MVYPGDPIGFPYKVNQLRDGDIDTGIEHDTTEKISRVYTEIADVYSTSQKE